jgi:hypothetical protein
MNGLDYRGHVKRFIVAVHFSILRLLKYLENAKPSSKGQDPNIERFDPGTGERLPD